MINNPSPSALLFISSDCPHCPLVLDGVVRMVKGGRLARLEVVNLTDEPELAQRYGVRTVPWLRLGPFELTGALSPSDLADWVQYAATGEGWSAYYAHLLENRRLDEVVRRIRKTPSSLAELLNLLTDEEIPMATRIGISAVMEELPDTQALNDAAAQLEQLTLSESPQTRADACHFLGLTGDRRAIPAIRRLLDDEQDDVREIALETLGLLGNGRGGDC